MLYTQFKDLSLSLLGFGAMRLPMTPDGAAIDEKQTEEMIRYAIAHGVNYFDTAYPYLGGQSERVLGQVLRAFPRESFFLADKFPGHQLAKNLDVPALFEEQLQKCRVDYFDFYLLHNVYENSIPYYEDAGAGVLDYLLRQRDKGRIRHLGFSTHALPENLEGFLDRHAHHLEFCQIQLNYLDWTLQHAREKMEMIAAHGLPVWVMEPVRGGKLASLPTPFAHRMKMLRPKESQAAWAFRWLQDMIPDAFSVKNGTPASVPAPVPTGIKVILSGMSHMEQVKDNISTFEDKLPLNRIERNLLEEMAASMTNSIPCTACRYCCDGCPAGLDIPGLLHQYNELRVEPTFAVTMYIESLPEELRPAACMACGQCSAVCPQKIEIPEALADFAQRLQKLPSWEEICRARWAAAGIAVPPARN